MTRQEAFEALENNTLVRLSNRAFNDLDIDSSNVFEVYQLEQGGVVNLYHKETTEVYHDFSASDIEVIPFKQEL